MGLGIRPDPKGAARWWNRWITKEKASLLFANGLVLSGMERPPAFRVESLPPGLARFILLPILMMLYIYLASRVGAYIGRLSRSHPSASGSPEEAPDLFL